MGHKPGCVGRLCGGSQVNSIIPTGEFLPDVALTDPTGSCDNAFACISVDGGIVVLSNSSGNVFGDTFFDEAQDISADVSGDGPYVLYSTCGSWAPPLPSSEPWVHMGGCGIGVVGVGGFTTTVNITYDYSHGFPPETGKGLNPHWAVNATTPWDTWRFNAVTNDPVTMTLGPMQVPVTCSADVPCGEFSDVMFLAPFWAEERSSDDPGHEIFMQSLMKNKKAGYFGPDGVFVPDVPQEGTVVGTDDTSGDDSGAPQQSGADGTGGPASDPATSVVAATATEEATTPVPTTTPAGAVPVIGALGILGAVIMIRRR